MINIEATYFYENNKPTNVTKEISPLIVIDTIRNYISEQYEYTFPAKPNSAILESLVDGFILFNLHKNKYMIKSKEALLKYVKDRSIAIQEKEYFLHIYLHNQRPNFLSYDEHEYLRACGDLDGFYDGFYD
jgi:hypothetical protein